MKTLLLTIVLGLPVAVATAQTAPAFTISCRSQANSTRQQYCETRDLTLPAATSGPLVIDGRANGGITVHGYDGSNVQVRAQVTAWATTAEAARQTVQGISIGTTGQQLRAESQAGASGWSVSYEVFVPRKTALKLKTVNGSIQIGHVAATIAFEAVNGSVTLQDVGGKVSGNTTNGGLRIQLTGSRWEGAGLDVSTTNGGITWELPANYSARLHTSTTIGGITTRLPVTKTGMLSKEVTASLGQGGALLRAVTTNGGITVRQ